MPTKEIQEDRVDLSSEGSFPASDPPGWGSSHAAPSEVTIIDAVVEAEPVAEAPEPIMQPVRKRRIRPLVIAAGVSLGALTALGLALRARARRC